MGAHLIVALVSGAVSFLATGPVRRIALRIGAVDVPNDRKIHLEPTATLGGLALYAGLLAGLVAAHSLHRFGELFRTSSEPLGVFVAATIIVLVGVADDLRGLGAWTKIAGQVLAAGALVFAGIQLFYFWIPRFGVISLSSDLSALLTVLWTVAVVNAVNLIDGLDGLAAGVSGIAALSFFVYAWASARGVPSTATLVSAIVVGACAGFLPHNFNPARIFMGDAGSMLLGVLMASATVSGVGRTTEPQFADLAGLAVPVLLPMLVLAVPLADAGLAILRRVRGRRPVFHADKQHIHHWLLEMASSHRRAVLVMYLWSAMLAGAALALGFRRGLVGTLTAGVLIAGLLIAIVALPRAMRRRTPAPAALPPSVKPTR